jgi:F-type H+-transporting ATPase subunit delta
MAELATIARPYAEALFKAAGTGQLAALAPQVQALADVASLAEIRQFADNPKVAQKQVFELVTSLIKTPLADAAKNLLSTVIDNGRLAVLPAIASHFQSLVSASSGVSEATIYSAFEIAPAQLTDVVSSLEKRFGHKLNAHVVIEPALIGGIRVVVGDEVLDTSVKARLEQMKAALTA